MGMPTASTRRSLLVDTPGARLAVCDYAGEGDPVVLLHGGPGCPDYLGPVAELLAPAHRAITFDQRGVGGSRVLNDRFEVADYLEDLEALRTELGIDRWHLFGHSWGGLLAQLYAGAHPNHVLSLFLCNSSLGVGADWKRTQQESMRYNRRQSGRLEFVALGLWSILLTAPLSIGHWATKNLYRVVWRNYFRDPKGAPPAREEWLAGANGRAMSATSHALGGTEPSALPDTQTSARWSVLVLFGKYDIYGEAVDLVFARYPSARQVILDTSGHVPWLQAPEEFAEALRQFYTYHMAAPDER